MYDIVHHIERTLRARLSLKHRLRKEKWAVAKVQVMMLNQDSSFEGVTSDSYTDSETPWQARMTSMDVSRAPDTANQWEAWVQRMGRSAVEFGFSKPSSL
jgi:hypothetical protein